jgi:hypothetical protein
LISSKVADACLEGKQLLEASLVAPVVATPAAEKAETAAAPAESATEEEEIEGEEK